jgi:hypothetical protein
LGVFGISQKELYVDDISQHSKATVYMYQLGGVGSILWACRTGHVDFIRPSTVNTNTVLVPTAALPAAANGTYSSPACCSH